MNFVTPAFFAFFCAFLLCFWALPERFRKSHWLLLIGASLYFYSFTKFTYVLLLMGNCLFHYWMGKKVFSEKPENKQRWVTLCCLVDLGLLAYFKYSLFLVLNIESTIQLLGNFQLPHPEIFLPIGISFFTFQGMSYVIDIYRGKIPPADNLMIFSAYQTAFPHLVAGPIVRASTLVPQLESYPSGRRNLDRIRAGLYLIVLGFLKKSLLGDNLAELIVDPVFASPDKFSGTTLLLASISYSFQIFFDFSGYTDIAIGLAKLIGLEFEPNFRFPYVAKSIEDFWKRWHISLSSWLRDYLYISLGGNRGSNWKTYRNLFITMALGGIWHGASWNFLIWGCYHGLLLVMMKALRNRFPGLKKFEDGYTFAPLVFIAVTIGWIFFRATNLEQAAQIFKGIFTFQSGELLISSKFWIIFVLSALMCVESLNNSVVSAIRRLPGYAQAALGVFLLFLTFLLAPTQYKAFIYFQF